MKPMFIILFILFIGIPLLKESIENQSYREECRRRGYDTYWSTDGVNTDVFLPITDGIACPKTIDYNCP